MKRYSSILATACLVIGVLITSIAIITSRFGWSIQLEKLAHFQVQYFLGAIALTIILLCLRKRRFALAMLFCCALLSVPIISWYSLKRPFVEMPANYRVISANVWKQNTNAEKVLAFVKAEDPDLALFMEVNDEMGKQLEALETILPYNSNQLTPYRLGTVLYSKTPLSEVQLQQFNTRSAVHISAHVEANGRSFSVVGIHPFPPINPELFVDRNRAFEAVSEYVKAQSDPVILMGDFNVTMWSPYYRQIARQSGLSNTRSGAGILPTWPATLSYLSLPDLGELTRLLQIPIDHCLVSSSLKVVGMHTGPDIGSDHLPIAIDLQMDRE